MFNAFQKKKKEHEMKHKKVLPAKGNQSVNGGLTSGQIRMNYDQQIADRNTFKNASPSVKSAGKTYESKGDTYGGQNPSPVHGKKSKGHMKHRKHKKNWIAGAIKHPGALHSELGVKQGNKIPAKTLSKAAKKGGKIGDRARLAQTLKGFHHKNEKHEKEEKKMKHEKHKKHMKSDMHCKTCSC